MDVSIILISICLAGAAAGTLINVFSGKLDGANGPARRRLTWLLVLLTLVVAAATYALNSSGRNVDAGPSPTGAQSSITDPSPVAPTETSTPTQAPSPSKTGPAHTKAQYLLEADEVCTHFYGLNAEMQQSSASDVDKARQVHRILTNLVGDWSRVARPPRDTQKIESILSTYRKANEKYGEAIRYYQDGKFDDYRRLRDESEIQRRRAGLAARRYGHTVCGNY